MWTSCNTGWSFFPPQWSLSRLYWDRWCNVKWWEWNYNWRIWGPNWDPSLTTSINCLMPSSFMCTGDKEKKSHLILVSIDFIVGNITKQSILKWIICKKISLLHLKCLFHMSYHPYNNEYFLISIFRHIMHVQMILLFNIWKILLNGTNDIMQSPRMRNSLMTARQWHDYWNEHLHNRHNHQTNTICACALTLFF